MRRALARTAMWHDADIVVGTRYAGAGSGEGLDGAARLVSTVAVRLSKARSRAGWPRSPTR